ncbi:Bacteriophage T7 tail fibre protein [uncultured Caudovirales phage]|uniref:Bacteriophage T7 tail fibre protein n=1 Tax=uncultured Caudovirales phage TaxID=2100421 RepID=A0A6J5M2H1_9CAUD|nr:Bacteriophage T7 tail fibre protein [uncultured Caudovirales phage]
MPLASTQYTGNGSITTFAVTFPYLERAHVKVSVNGTPVTFTWASASTVTVSPAPANGSVVEVRRETDATALRVDFTDGSTLTEADLDLLARQTFFLTQEAIDRAGATLAVQPDGAYSANNRRIADVADPVDPQDVATKAWSENGMTSQLAQAQASANASAASAAAASTSATAAAGSVTSAAAQAANAAASATAAAGSVTAASNSAATASSHVTAAQTARTGAETARTGAETARTGAQAAQAAAEAAFDSFDDRYLGAKSSAPSVDNDGATLFIGALYWDTTLNRLRVWSGSAWQSIEGGITQAAADARYVGVWKEALTNVQDFGILPGAGNASANVTAFNANYAAMRALGRPIYWPPTNGDGYFFNAPLVVDNSANFDLGMTWVGGGGWRRTRIQFTGLTSGQVALRFNANHAVPPANLSDWYGLELKNLSFFSAHDGCLVAIGKDDFSDPVNTPLIENCLFANSSTTANPEALRLNGVYNGVFINVYANCFANGAGTQYGKALRVRQGAFNTFIGGAYGNADMGVCFENGISYAHKFESCTFENTRIGIYCGTGNSGRHTFINCAYSLHVDWAFQAPAGFGDGRFQIIGGNCNPTTKLLDPNNCVGIDANGIAHAASLPGLPANGVTVRNTTGRTFNVKLIGGTFTNFLVNGFGYGADFRDFTINPWDEYRIESASGVGWVARQIR